MWPTSPPHTTITSFKPIGGMAAQPISVRKQPTKKKKLPRVSGSRYGLIFAVTTSKQHHNQNFTIFHLILKGMRF